MDLHIAVSEWAEWPAVVAALLLAGGFGHFQLNSRVHLLKE